MSHGPWLWVVSGGKSRRSLPTAHLQAARARQCRASHGASANATALWLTAAPADTGQARHARLTWEQSGPWQCQTERRAGQWPGAPGGLNPARPPEHPEHLFRAVCALQSVGLQGCLRNRSEKNRLVQTYELRSALTIIRRGSLSASRICNDIQLWRSLRSSNPRNRLEGAVSGRTE